MSRTTSATSTKASEALFAAAEHSTSNATNPDEVFAAAFCRRLIKTCARTVRSSSTCRVGGGRVVSIFTPGFSCGETMVMTLCTTSYKLHGSKRSAVAALASSFSIWDSPFRKLRACSVHTSALCSRSADSAGAWLPRRRCATTPFNGLRSSWKMIAIRFLSRSASALAFARSSSVFLRFASAIFPFLYLARR